MLIERAQLGEDGHVLIPASLRRELRLRPGDTIVLESDGDSLLLRGDDVTHQQAGSAAA